MNLRAQAKSCWMVGLLGFGLVACSQPASESGEAASLPIGYGTVMAEVGRRFELLGRAADAGRFELATYQLGEIVEQFEQALPRAAQPQEGNPNVLPALADEFVRAKLPELQTAIEARDRNRVAAAFEQVARACNGCHQASGHGFIEVPLVAGRPIPNTDPVPEQASAN